jgi:phenylacetate-CoA ligase
MSLSYSNPRLRNLYYRCPTVLKEWLALVYSFRQHSNRFGGVFAAQLAELERHIHRSVEEIAQDQLACLKRMVIHAGANVPYYRQLFQSVGFKPESLQSLDDLRRIPLLDKETVREQYDELIATSKVGRTIAMHTSGTTGKALHLIISQEANQRYYAWWWFHYGWAGIQRGDRVATFWGQPVAAPDSLRPPFWVRDRLENELFFSSQHITPHTLPLYADALADFKPVLIRGYPSSIYLLALYLLETGREDIRPKAVYPSSETLFDFQRKVIEQAFGCKAYSYYGNAERVAQFLQCREGNFHVATEACVVEVLNADGSPAAAGELGELVCTGLINRAMPLIRYRVGDTGIAAADQCACGMNTPILSSLTGRVEDIVVTPDGRHVGRLDHAFKGTLNVKEAQIVQEDVHSILIKIVPRQGFSSDNERVILDELRLRLGYEIRIHLQLVDRIPRTATGKFRFVISKVPIQIGSSLVGCTASDSRVASSRS